jgi:hypothetical protein
MVGSKVTALSNRHGGLERRDLRLTELQFHIYCKENDVPNSCKNLRAIQRSDQKLRALRTGTLV